MTARGACSATLPACAERELLKHTPAIRVNIVRNLSTPPQLAFFCDPRRLQRDLEHLRSLLQPELVSSLPALLAECADPVQALNLFERLITTRGQELLRLLEKKRALLQHIVAIFGQSYWLGEMVIKDPGILDALRQEKHLERPLEREDFQHNLERFRARSAQSDVSTLLSAFKKYEYIRIALRDILRLSTLAETTGELSALADVILEHALQEAQAQARVRFGNPPRSTVHNKAAQLSILALGKLGGSELNYSSDLDLLYLYPDQDLHDPAATREYFTRQAQWLTDILCCTTAEGSVFRIDLRLRPQGSEGEIAIGLHQALEYYGHVARDWELQALIKARHSAGEHSLSNEFIRGVQPRIYTQNINFAAIETALHSRERIQGRRRLRGFRSNPAGAVDVKLDRGGIRDIEFLVQCLQRVYGGEEKWLRSGGTLFSLQKLHDKGHISGKDFHELTLAYEFLRAVEHRLQLQHGWQVHRLPAEPESLSALSRAMAPRTSSEPSADFRETLLEHMRKVSGIYDRTIFSQRRRQEQAGGAAPAPPTASTAREMSFDQVLDRIAQDSPTLHQIATRGHPIRTRKSLHRFLSSAMTSSERYAALLQNPAAVEKAIPLLAASDCLREILVRHPDAIRALDPIAGENGGTAPNWPENLRSAASDPLHPARALDALRQSFRKFSFSIAAHDVLAPGPVFQSLRRNSALADAAIGQALQMLAGRDTLAVFALGRLGTEEFDIASDADLLFVKSADTDEESARTTAKELVHALAAYTREGLIFPVDTRLRPYGNEGELVITPAHLQRYLVDEARPWEALTYSKLRFIAGRKDLAAAMLPQVWHNIREMASRPGLAPAVAEMRVRLEKSNRYPCSFKLARGGFYDVDFIVSFLMLRQRSAQSGNTLERLESLYRAGVLEQSAFQELRDATQLYRTTDHVIRLVTGHARPELPAAEHARDAVEALVNRILNPSGASDLQRRLNATAEKVRTIFQQIVHPNGNGA